MALIIVVQERSSSQCKQRFHDIQFAAGVGFNEIKTLVIDMKVRWSSTYMMLNHAYSLCTACLSISLHGFTTDSYCTLAARREVYYRNLSSCQGSHHFSKAVLTYSQR